MSHPKKGDCFRACLTSILGIKNDPRYLPDVSKKDWFIKYSKFLAEIGVSIHWDDKKIWRQGYWIATVKSKNFSEVTHAIVMNGTEVYHDPSLGKRYKAGRSLLGDRKKIVKGGWWLEIDDASKLYRLTYLQRHDA